MRKIFENFIDMLALIICIYFIVICSFALYFVISGGL